MEHQCKLNYFPYFYSVFCLRRDVLGRYVLLIRGYEAQHVFLVSQCADHSEVYHLE